MSASIDNSPLTPVKKRDYLFLLALSIMVILVIVIFEPVPGYMDADYYFAGGKQLASGQGFVDPFLWNYLDHPEAIPHPSNSYWYPLASILAAGGMAVTGKFDFLSARIVFVLITASVPLVVTMLAYRLTRRRQLALATGFLTIFSGYYLPFISTTDNYGVYLLLGAIFFLMLDKITMPKAVLFGILAGFFNLARGDGLLWLPLTLFAVLGLTYRQIPKGSRKNRITSSIKHGLTALIGYLLVMGAWFARNLAVFGEMLPPGSGHVLWMTSYNQLFSFTPEIYTFQTWLASGLMEAMKVRVSALWQNLGTAFIAQGMIFLVPLVIIAVWKHRHSFRVQFAVLGWVVMLVAESLLFPFASVRGGFFHAGAAFQPMWFVLAPMGLEGLIVSQVRDQRRARSLLSLFSVILVAVMVSFSVLLVKMRVLDSGWNEGEYLYQETEVVLRENGASPDAVVMVRNPPAYFIMNNRPAIVIPYGDVQSLLAAAKKYGATYLVIEPIWKDSPIQDLYYHPENYPEFTSLGVLSDSHILLINSSQ